MEKTNYSNCPLKKRPIQINREENKKNQNYFDSFSEESEENAPVDLSNKNSLSLPSLDTAENAIDFSKRRNPSFVEEKSSKYEYARKEATHHKRIVPRTFSRIKSENYETFSEGNEENTFIQTDWSQRKLFVDVQHLDRQNGSPYPRMRGNFNFESKFEDNENNNYNGHHSDVYFPSVQHSILYSQLSPISESEMPIAGVRQKFPITSDNVEPQDLSVKNEKRILSLQNPISNTQKYQQQSQKGTNFYNDFIDNRSYKKDSYFQCQMCDKLYASSKDVEIHYREVHGSLFSPGELDAPSEVLKRINERDLPIGTEYIRGNSASPYTSNNCNTGEVDEEKSSRKHNPSKYQCNDCGKSYSTYSGLTKHKQFHCTAREGNQPKKSFSCKTCDKTYVSLGALKMHIRTHTLPCKCPLCGKAFSRPWLLQGHIRTHTGEKPFSCQFCNRAFADRSNLRAHLQTHSDVKKYSCKCCTKTFSRMSLLAKHIQSGCPGNNNNNNSIKNNIEHINKSSIDRKLKENLLLEENSIYRFDEQQQRDRKNFDYNRKIYDGYWCNTDDRDEGDNGNYNNGNDETYSEYKSEIFLDSDPSKYANLKSNYRSTTIIDESQTQY